MNSQHIRSAGDGRILYFEVDGDLYDGNGWLIADRRGPGCNECLEPGVMEFVSVPVPGSCNLFYLVSAVPRGFGYDGSHVQWSILDMDADNPRFPTQSPQECNRKGRLLHLYDDIGAAQPVYPQFSAWSFTPENGAFPIPDHTSDHVGRLDSDPIGKSITPMIRVAESANNNGDHWLFFVLPDRVYVYRMSTNGIFKVDPLPNDSRDYVPTYHTITPWQHKQYFRDADAVRADDPVYPDGVMVLAMTDGFAMNLWPDLTGDNYNLLVLRFNAATGHLLEQEGEAFALYPNPQPCVNASPAPNIAYGLRGCALRPDGGGVFITGERNPDCAGWEAFVEHVELGSGAITDLTYAFTPSMDPQLTRSRIYRNTAPDGTGDALYFPGTTTVGALVGLDNLAGVSFVQDAFSSAQSPVFDPGPFPGSAYYPPRFINIGIAGDRYLSTANRATCCTFLNTHGNGVVEGHIQEGYAVWSATSNPHGNAATLTFNCDLVVKPGASLFINNMTLRFAPDAKIIVERGGRLFMHNTWANSLSCPGDRWPGIRVEGTTGNGDQLGSAQGQLRMDGGGVSNAVVGAWTARELANGSAHSGYFGGVIRAVAGTSFLNCITGVRIERYQRTSGAGAVLPNFSFFSGCNFETTGAWPDPGLSVPQYQAHLFDVQGIKFQQCKFINHAPGMFPLLNRGYGILALFAGFDADGSTVQDASLFKDLTIGVAAATGTLRKANVRRSWFRGNLIGAYMQGCTAPEVSRSTFFVPAAVSPNAPMGLVLHQSTAYLVEENTFNGGGMAFGNIGIHFIGDVLAENRIYNNSFNGLNAGTYVLGRHKGNTQQTEYLGLQLLCGDYTGGGLDHLLGNDTYIKEAQGNVSADPALTQLAGNRFFSGAINGITISTAQPSSPSPFFNYLRHDVQECDPLNPSPYYSDIAIDAGPFDKATACDQGLLPNVGGGGGTAGYVLVAAQLKSAQSYFLGTVDIGEREDIKLAITQDNPWLPSHTLRDYLLARCPLSDEVLLAVLHRPVPLDPWHLTQVLLGNAKLTPRVLRAVETSGLLNEYMLAIVRNAGNGPTLKDLLRQEVELRAMEKARAQVLAFSRIAGDSLITNPHDTLYAMLAAHPDPSDYYLLAGIAMELGDHATARNWLDSLVAAKADEPTTLRDLVTLHEALGGDWALADGTQREQLAQMAHSSEPGGAMAWAILYHLGATDEVPTAEIPDGTKRLSWAPDQATRPMERPLLEAHPNPTMGTTWAVISVELDDTALLRISDPQGRVVRTVHLAAGQRLQELDLSGLANGLYTCELQSGEFKLDVAKITVQR